MLQSTYVKIYSLFISNSNATGNPLISGDKVESGDLISRSKNPNRDSNLWGVREHVFFRQNSLLHWRLV